MFNFSGGLLDSNNHALYTSVVDCRGMQRHRVWDEVGLALHGKVTNSGGII